MKGERVTFIRIAFYAGETRKSFLGDAPSICLAIFGRISAKLLNGWVVCTTTLWPRVKCKKLSSAVPVIIITLTGDAARLRFTLVNRARARLQNRDDFRRRYGPERATRRRIFRISTFLPMLVARSTDEIIPRSLVSRRSHSDSRPFARACCDRAMP